MKIALTILLVCEQMMTPEEGIGEGSLFGFGPQADLNELWTKDQGTFSLGLEGDTIFLYCLDGLNKIRFLSGFSNAGRWKAPFLNHSEYGHNSSALPESIVNSSIALPHLFNYHYAGPRDARINLLRRSILDPYEWEGSNLLRYRMGTVPDTDRLISGGAPTGKVALAALCVGVLTWVLS